MARHEMAVRPEDLISNLCPDTSHYQRVSAGAGGPDMEFRSNLK